jgi:undecaprenyl-diphosphatase
LLVAALLPHASRAQNCGWSHIDHRVAYDASGVWDPKAYRATEVALSVAQVAGALWYGADDRLGRTAWQGIDSELLSAAGAEVGKRVFTRTRPSEADNPCLWFQGSGNYSFPSGEAAVMAGLVTPYVLEYGQDHPTAYGLLLFPLYVGEGRIKNQAHWQTDVLAAWALGGAAGLYAHSRQVPLTVQVLPHAVSVGWKHSF